MFWLNRSTLTIPLLAAALAPAGPASAATVTTPDYGAVQVLSDGALLVSTFHGSYALIYTTPIDATSAKTITGSDPAPVLYRYTDNTVPPTTVEIASNPFLAGTYAHAR